MCFGNTAQGLLSFIFFLISPYQGPYNWVASEDTDWSSGSGWNTSVAPDRSNVVQIRPGGICVVDGDTDYAAANILIVGKGSVSGARMVIDDDGYVQVRQGLRVALDSDADLTVVRGGISSESVSIGSDVGTGVITLNQGVILTQSLAVESGELKLTGGMFFLSLNDPDLLTVQPGAWIDIFQGALVLNGDHTASNSVLNQLIADERIRAVDAEGAPAESGQLQLRFVEGKTIVEAVNPRAAAEPFPICGENSYGYENAELSWTAASRGEAQRLYLHPDYDLVEGRDDSALTDTLEASAASCGVGTLTPHLHYYWSVDTLVSNTWVSGPVWRFTTGEEVQTYSGGQGFLIGADGEVLKDGTPFRGFGLTFHYAREDMWNDDPAGLEEQLGPMFDDLEANQIPFLRAWFHMDDLWFVDKLRFFEKKDALIDLAASRNIQLFPQIGGSPLTLLERSGETLSDLADDNSWSIELLRKYTRDFVVRYRTSPVICGWEEMGDIMNSADQPADDLDLTRPQMWNLYDEWSKEVATWDPYRCCESGQTFTHLEAWHMRYEGVRIQDTPEQYEEMVLADMDSFNTASFHVYPGKRDRLARSMRVFRRVGKPAYLGEWGGIEREDFDAVVLELEENDALFGTLFCYYTGPDGHPITLTDRRDILAELNRMNAESSRRAFFIHPSNEEFDVPADVEFDWINGEDVTQTKVYLSTNLTEVESRSGSALAAVLDSSETSYAPSGLQAGTQYYWALDTSASGGDISGAVRSFWTEGYVECMDAEDAFVYNGSPDRNYESDWRLRIREGAGNKYRSYIRFEVDQIGTCTVSSVDLVFSSDDYTGPVELYAVSTDWQADSLTWSNAPALPADPLDIQPALAGGTVEFDVSSVVTEDGVYAFALKAGDDLPLGVLYSFENEVEIKPVLKIKITEGEE